MMTCDLPSPRRTIIYRKWRYTYFLVPVKCLGLFQRLVLITNSQRSRRILPVSKFFPVTVQEVESDIQGDGATRALTVKLAIKVPNGIGHIDFSIRSNTVRYEISAFRPPGAARPSQTNRIILNFKLNADDTLKTVDDFKKELPLTGKFYLDNFFRKYKLKKRGKFSRAYVARQKACCPGTGDVMPVPIDDSDLDDMTRLLNELKESLHLYRKKFCDIGLSVFEIERALDPLRLQVAQIEHDIKSYRRSSASKLPTPKVEN